jgi:hypothetical protein
MLGKCGAKAHNHTYTCIHTEQLTNCLLGKEGTRVVLGLRRDYSTQGSIVVYIMLERKQPAKLVDLRAPDSARGSGMDTARSIPDNQSDAGRSSVQGDPTSLDSARLSTKGDAPLDSARLSTKGEPPPAVNPGQSSNRAPSVAGSDTSRLSASRPAPKKDPPPRMGEASPSNVPGESSRLSVRSEVSRADSSGMRTPRQGTPSDASRTVLTSDFTRTLGVYDAVKAQAPAN